MIKPIRNSYLQLLQYTTAAGMEYSGVRCFTVYHSHARRWFPARNWCVPVSTEVLKCT